MKPSSSQYEVHKGLVQIESFRLIEWLLAILLHGIDSWTTSTHTTFHQLLFFNGQKFATFFQRLQRLFFSGLLNFSFCSFSFFVAAQCFLSTN